MNSQMTSKAKWVADMMKADGIKAEQVTTELVLAYFDAVGKKIERIQNTYLTRTGAKDALQTYVANFA